jgi:hypothetical protein
MMLARRRLPDGLLRHRPIQFYFWARSVSEFSYQIAAVAVGWQVYALTGMCIRPRYGWACIDSIRMKSAGGGVLFSRASCAGRVVFHGIGKLPHEAHQFVDVVDIPRFEDGAANPVARSVNEVGHRLALSLPSAVLRSSAIELMGSGLGSIAFDRFVWCVGELLRATVAGGFKIAARPVCLSESNRHGPGMTAPSALCSP